MPMVLMPLARFRPMQAMVAQTQRRPMGESLNVRSMKCAQKRRLNMIAEVQIKSCLPCSEVKRLPVIF